MPLFVKRHEFVKRKRAHFPPLGRVRACRLADASHRLRAISRLLERHGHAGGAPAGAQADAAEARAAEARAAARRAEAEAAAGAMAMRGAGSTADAGSP